ncbi:hypothetical protein AJ85_04100 [Alkalihalobacillus alcalophilus ATCC 27647 = CGMCC 1.3604]|uniref:Uncharacterized protein n=1 Tax=Alkalihalobacillus alcalophilus ATCC 27647 = CGMCC 1.3604 TaxID=1218173 RepID=A0A094WNF7_ALKAL|nr:hypothetical protein [Alkalihalobacillus alcalophilus]KGA98371.1 hypothetical protein BALCAV_0204630 [Alkalihalobacillus alcalophilus ATCC 27647 = CGMCC 1.3604]MED1563670.1 hypothetical protein [Alkalihalobacillus alcalophilus]THG91629.1 hypothetical protein AJ85_04100 [Alkalihalobacillus alcalophilus ATCC 27647 = CGMCC 1.3604]
MNQPLPKMFWFSYAIVFILEISLVLFFISSIVDILPSTVVISLVAMTFFHPVYIIVTAFLLKLKGYEGMTILKAVIVMILPLWLAWLIIFV